MYAMMQDSRGVGAVQVFKTVDEVMTWLVQ
jgi:hypothetical protein